MRFLRTILMAFILLVALVLAETDVAEWLEARRERVAATRTKEAVVDAVESYNKTLIWAHLTNRATSLKGLATKAEIERVRMYITYNVLEKKQVLSNRLVDLDILKITVSKKGGSAVVKAKEQWVYTYIDKDTRKKASPPERARYRSTYRLTKPGKRWLVAKVEIDH